MYRQIELYKTPRDILQKTSESYCEMTAEEHGFLCGLIKTFCPKKVVEVGDSGGISIIRAESDKKGTERKSCECIYTMFW